MNIWDPRSRSYELLEGPLAADAALVEAGIAELERIVPLLVRHSDSPQSRLAALLLAKAHRLSIGIYSMAIDSVGQEAGALVRPLQELYEFLEYLRTDSSRIDVVLAGKKPTAGRIAKDIGGRLHDLRRYLNDHASHIALSIEALGHLVDLDSGEIRMARDPGDGATLRANLVTLTALLNLVLTEGLLILDQIDPTKANELFIEHEARCQAAKQHAISLGLFKPSADAEE